MPASHFDVNSMTGRPKFIVRHSTCGLQVVWETPDYSRSYRRNRPLPVMIRPIDVGSSTKCVSLQKRLKCFFCGIVLYLVVYHVCFQDGKLCLLVANDKLDGK
jgi:hypothetical protein